MPFQKLMTAAILALGLIAVSACGGKDKKEETDAKSDNPSSDQTFASLTRGDVYHSPYFGLTVEKPGDWYAMSAEEFADAMGLGTKLVAGGNEQLEAVLNAGEQQTANIFAFYEYEVGAPVDFNPSVAAVAENVSFAPGVKDRQGLLLSHA